jgi:holliday junction DNA helicase RuvA
VYEYLEGEIASRSPGRLVLDVGGVGYELSVPLVAAFPDSGRFRAWTHFVVREDAHVLCGFPDRATRDLFRLLIEVRGVGPTMALSVLSGIAREALLEAIAEGDLATLLRIKGVGKKTGEQILLDLREKAKTLRAEQVASGRAPSSRGAERDSNVEDAIAALVSIGYSEKEARKSVEKAAQRVEDKTLEGLVRAALTT